MTSPDPHQGQVGRFYGIEGSICQEYPCPDPLLSQSKRFYGIRDLSCQEMRPPDPHQGQGGRFYGIGVGPVILSEAKDLIELPASSHTPSYSPMSSAKCANASGISIC